MTVKHPFVIDREYLKTEIAGFLGGGNRQSGIMYGSLQTSFVAIFVGGSHSTMSAYPDELGSSDLRYCGQGSSGDQKLSGANAVLADSLRTVLLFESKKQKKGMALNRFAGEYKVTGYEKVLGKEERASDTLILFKLSPTKIITSAINQGFKIKRDGRNQPYIEWRQAGKGYKRAWMQTKRDAAKDWAGSKRYLNVVRIESFGKGPAGNATDFPVFSNLSDEQILTAFVTSVSAITGCELAVDE